MRRFKDKDEALAFIMNELPWGIAAGVCKNGTLARKYAQAGIKIVSYGSITKLSRAGNPGENFWCDNQGNSINAWGIPNKGIDEHLEELPQVRKDVNAHSSELWVSISAGDKFDDQEYHDMARMIAQKKAADVIEGNMSCGNMVMPNGQYKPIVCYDLELFELGVAALKLGAADLKTSVKLTPTTERRYLIANVEICLKYGVDYIVLANTIPNGYLERPAGYEPVGKPAISMGRGGLGGAALRPIVTGMVQMVAPMLKGTKTKLIAAGGISTSQDLYRYLRHGAHGGVFATLMWQSNFDPAPAQEIILGKDIDYMTRRPGLVDLLVDYGFPD